MLRVLYFFVTPWAKANAIQIFINRVLGGIANILYPLWCKIVPINSKSKQKNESVIISFTSFPGRIEKVYLCAQSLLRQNVKAHKIILWLADEQFPGHIIPHNLEELKEKGLEIRFCEDYRSYKKFFCTAKEFMDKKIVIVDDDTLYPENWLQRLIMASDKNPQCVTCYRAHDILFSANKKVLPYKQWDGLSPDKTGPSFSLIPVGVGGVMYPMHFFADFDFDFEPIYRLCLKSDDIWLKIMALKKGIATVKVDANSKEWFTIRSSQRVSLMAANVGLNKNDEALNNLIDDEKLDLYMLCHQ